MRKQKEGLQGRSPECSQSGCGSAQTTRQAFGKGSTEQVSGVGRWPARRPASAVTKEYIQLAVSRCEISR